MPIRNKQSRLIGIDFGTTKTSVFCCPVGSHDVVPFKTIPTGMILPPDSGPRNWRPVETSKYIPPPGSLVLDRFKMEIESTKPIYEKWRNADIAGRFLADLRKELEERFTIEGLTVTVPAEWSIPKRQATLYAVHLANFLCPVALLEEPLAAFLRFYDLDEDLAKEYRRVLVFDFGGGTCDISIIDLNRPKPKVLKSKTVTIGGTDIDDLIVRWWLHRAELSYEKIQRHAPLDMSTLRYLAEDHKIILSDDVASRRARGHRFEFSDISVPGEFEFKEISRPAIGLEMSAQKLEELVEEGLCFPKSSIEIPGVIQRVKQALEEFLQEYDPGNQVGCVIISGGTCKLWAVQDFLDTFFEERHRSVDFLPELGTLRDPETHKKVGVADSVGRGAALHQYYVAKGNPVAIPSLNYPVEIIISCEGRELQRLEFKEGASLPISRWDIFKKRAWYVYPFAKGRRFEISVLHDNEEVGFSTIPTDGLSRLSELAWLGSVNEYGLVQFHVHVINPGQLRRLKEDFYLYPAVEDFAIDKEILFEKQQELRIYGG